MGKYIARMKRAKGYCFKESAVSAGLRLGFARAEKPCPDTAGIEHSAPHWWIVELGRFIIQVDASRTHVATQQLLSVEWGALEVGGSRYEFGEQETVPA